MDKNTNNMQKLTIMLNSNEGKKVKIEVEISNEILKKFNIKPGYDKKNKTITKFPKVENVLRYIIEVNDNNDNYKIKREHNSSSNDFKSSKYFDKRISKREKNYKNIILILESPHKDEYTENFDPIAPAQGVTGKNIDNKIENLLMEIKQKQKHTKNNITYNFIIINPVPYQTSLAHFISDTNDQKKAKKLIWEKIWEQKFVQEDFKNLIEELKPEIIINACTRKFKNKIFTYLLNLLKDSTNNLLVETYHPSAPHWKSSNFGLKKIEIND